MEGLRSVCDDSEIVTRDSNPELYSQLTSFWAAQNNLNPPVIVTPENVDSLSKVVKYLYTTDLDFGFRGHGYATPPIRDVIISLSALDGFTFDERTETVTVGAGQSWITVFQKMDELAPNYTVVGARTPSMSVGGTIVSGGFSWLSSEYGCISDPQNMIDCEVIKFDGSVIWAANEPDLLWAIRGGGPGFAVITKAIFKAHKLSRSIFCGTITVPMTSLPEAAKQLFRFLSSPVDPGVSAFMFIEKPKFQAMHMDRNDEQDRLVFQVFDRHGEEHGRQTFSCMLALPGAEDSTSVASMLEVERLQDRVDGLKGTSKQYYAPMIVPEFTQSNLERCITWFTDLEKYGKTIADNTMMIFELFCTSEGTESGAMAWPGPRGCNHMLIIGVGCGLEASEEDNNAAKTLAAEAPDKLMGNEAKIYLAPNAVEEWHDPQSIYGNHYPKLVELRSKYDPNRRFKGNVRHSL